MRKNQSNTKNLIDEIKSKLPLEQLLSHYNVRKAKGNNSYYCPFHEDKNPSFVASNEAGWKCLSNNNCGSGDQISFIQKFENISFEDALVKASNIADINLKRKKESKVYELQKKHIEYLDNRGIKTETAKIFTLKSNGDYILFPQNRNGEITGYKGINIKDKKKMHFEGEDKVSKLYPDYNFKAIKTVIFTAGEWDTLYINQKLSEGDLNAYKAVSSSTGETSFPKDLNRLKDFTEIEGFKIIYDHDEAGKNGALKLAKELHKLNKPIEIYYFPEGKPKGYDVSDFFNEGHSLDDLFNLEKVIYKYEEPAQLVESISMFSLDNFNFVTPYEYDISSKGITKISYGSKGEKVENISYVPVLITEQAINTDEDIVSLRLVFKRDGIWKKLQVEREIICDSKKLITLCNSGFPAHSGNAKKLVEYLNAFEITNTDNIKTVYLTHNNGWKEFKGMNIFGLGSNIFGLDSKNVNISFSPEQGFERFNKALHSQGSYENWLNIIKPLLKNPKIALSIYASLAAPLLNLVDCSSFILHYCGKTSMGKTTTIEIASSVWGNPSKETGGLVTSWNNTQVFVEKIATFFDDMPIYLDDSHLTDDKTLSRILYMLGNSTGRGRGTKTGGIRANTSWRTICFSTGEKQITESTQFDGAKARTVEISGTPFGRNEGTLVNKTKAGVRENYGHLGNKFISELIEELKDHQKANELKEDYRTFRDMLAIQAKDEVGHRIADYFGVIWLAGALMEKYLGIKTDVKEIVEKCYIEAINERQAEGDIETRALQDVISFAQANMKSFMGKADDSTKEHFGIWRDAEYIAFYPHKLKEFLGKNGFSYTSILRSWAEKDWIKNLPNELTYRITYESKSYRVILIKWEAVSLIIE